MFIFTRLVVKRTQYYEWEMVVVVVVERRHRLPGMIKDTHTAAQVLACQKNPSIITPLLRSSQFPGPGVYVCRAITHQLP